MKKAMLLQKLFLAPQEQGMRSGWEVAVMHCQGLSSQSILSPWGSSLTQFSLPGGILVYPCKGGLLGQSWEWLRAAAVHTPHSWPCIDLPSNECQSHRLVWVGKVLKSHLDPTPCHREAHLPLEQVFQGSSSLKFILKSVFWVSHEVLWVIMTPQQFYWEQLWMRWVIL